LPSIKWLQVAVI
ncbi:putative protease SohB, partial [Haemophilus influenzae]